MQYFITFLIPLLIIMDPIGNLPLFLLFTEQNTSKEQRRIAAISCGTAFAHDAVGENYFDMKRKCACSAENLILYGDGDEVIITTENRPVRFLLVAGQPIGEPVAWYGPIVMNTQEELQIAFEEYEKGTFIKHQ